MNIEGIEAVCLKCNSSKWDMGEISIVGEKMTSIVFCANCKQKYKATASILLTEEIDKTEENKTCPSIICCTCCK